MRHRALPAVLLTALCGCGASVERGEVAGQLRLNGKPLSEFVVTFVPDVGAHANAVRASGVTDAQGKFRLRSEDLQDKVVVGPYRIVLEDLAVQSAPRSPDGTVLRMPPVRVPAKYRDALSTPLQHNVKAGSETLDLNLPAN